MARKRATEPEIIVSTPTPARRKAPAARSKQRSAAPVAAAVEPAEVAETLLVQELPSRHEIAMLAYSYFVSRGHQGGSPEEDWLRAERELASKQKAASSAVA